MMGAAERRAQARARTLEAARWLRLIRYQSNPSAPVYSSAISDYADMLDPASTDARRLAACRVLLPGVLRRAAQERFAGEDAYARDRPLDPYRLEWRITPDGAVLEVIARTLKEAVAAFEAAEVSAEG